MEQQLCPKCQGAGTQSNPPHIAGDINEWTDNQTHPYTCTVCNGDGIIPTKLKDNEKT